MMALIRATSHRARERVERVIPDVEWLLCLRRDGTYAYVDDAVAEQVAAIPSVSRPRKAPELRRPIRMM